MGMTWHRHASAGPGKWSPTSTRECRTRTRILVNLVVLITIVYFANYYLYYRTQSTMMLLLNYKRSVPRKWSNNFKRFQALIEKYDLANLDFAHHLSKTHVDMNIAASFAWKLPYVLLFYLKQ